MTDLNDARWSVYIIQCHDGSFYTGISTDVARRFREHLIGKGAKYFRSRSPSRIVFVESGHCRSSASRREWVLKKMGHRDKADLIASFHLKNPI
ncbi:MAG: GIY-YIG nuclease family protein [Gammaproteobacteria bacterium]